MRDDDNVTPAGAAEHSRTGCMVLGFVTLTFAGILALLLTIPADTINAPKIAANTGASIEAVGIGAFVVIGVALLGIVELFSAVGRASMSQEGRHAYDVKRRAGNRKLAGWVFCAILTLVVLLGPMLFKP